QPVLMVDRPLTDEMVVVRRRAKMGGWSNLPSLNGTAVRVLDHADEVDTGFTAMYRLLLRHRTELLAPDGPLECFAQDEVRVIMRSTSTYARLLQESFHPGMLRDASERER